MKTHQIIIALAAFAAIGLCPTIATSAEPTPEEVKEYQAKLFKRIDHDGDGKVTEKEFVVAILYAVFTEEAGKDGKLTKDEYFTNSTEKTAKEEWALMDPEGTGEITFEDVFKNTLALDDLKKKFKKLDKNGRGFVTMDDVN